MGKLVKVTENDPGPQRDRGFLLPAFCAWRDGSRLGLISPALGVQLPPTLPSLKDYLLPFSLKEIKWAYLRDVGGIGLSPRRQQSARYNAVKMTERTVKPKRIYPRIRAWRADEG